jgi:3-oxoacyl-[acyl-carrier-protein] synthase II
LKERRVVITGMGIISPVGNRLDEAWTNVCEGNSGIQLVEDFDTTSFSTRIAGIVNNFDAADSQRRHRQ